MPFNAWILQCDTKLPPKSTAISNFRSGSNTRCSQTWFSHCHTQMCRVQIWFRRHKPVPASDSCSGADYDAGHKNNQNDGRCSLADVLLRRFGTLDDWHTPCWLATWPHLLHTWCTPIGEASSCPCVSVQVTPSDVLGMLTDSSIQGQIAFRYVITISRFKRNTLNWISVTPRCVLRTQRNNNWSHRIIVRLQGLELQCDDRLRAWPPNIILSTFIRSFLSRSYVVYVRTIILHDLYLNFLLNGTPDATIHHQRLA